jgi:hypothetical protein
MKSVQTRSVVRKKGSSGRGFQGRQSRHESLGKHGVVKGGR